MNKGISSYLHTFVLLLWYIDSSFLMSLSKTGEQTKYVYEKFVLFKERQDIYSSEEKLQKEKFATANNSKAHKPRVSSEHRMLQSDDKFLLSEQQVTLDEVYISVKTTKKYHGSRLQLIVDTWFQFAKNQTFFYTDENDKKFDLLTGFHMVNTHCGGSHTRHDLSCKMSAEYDGFLASGKKWWCHFDDDNYVNVKRLLALLSRFDWQDDIYLGKPSLDRPVAIKYKNKSESFSFATGGAGVCVSKSLSQKMAPWSSNGGISKLSDEIRIPDDCTLGFIVSNRLSVNLTVSSLLHSHLERLRDLDFSTITDQVTLSYHLNDADVSNNVISVPASMSLPLYDPTRILSIHCVIHPLAKICR